MAIAFGTQFARMVFGHRATFAELLRYQYSENPPRSDTGLETTHLEEFI